MQYASFFAVWLLSGLILGVVHGPALGTFLGLGIATGYLLAVRTPALMAAGANVCSASLRLVIRARRLL